MTNPLKQFDPLNHTSGTWATVNGQLAELTKDGTIVRFHPICLNLDHQDHIPTGGPQQTKTYRPAPKFGRRRKSRGER